MTVRSNGEFIINLCSPILIAGDVSGNADNIIKCSAQAYTNKARLTIFPELALTGYNIKDKFWSPEFQQIVKKENARIKTNTALWTEMHLLFGTLNFDINTDESIYLKYGVHSRNKPKNPVDNMPHDRIELIARLLERPESKINQDNGTLLNDSLLDIENLLPGDSNTKVFMQNSYGNHRRTYNIAKCFYQGSDIYTYTKKSLANYGVFDEMRYYNPRSWAPELLCIDGRNFAIMICEDLWVGEVYEEYNRLYDNIDTFIIINASPYQINKKQQRIMLISKLAKASGKPVIYINHCGGQNELVFDGDIIICDIKGDIVLQIDGLSSDTQNVSLDLNILMQNNTSKADLYIPENINLPQSSFTEKLSPLGHLKLTSVSTLAQDLYQALMLGLSSYLRDKSLTQVVLGLSGGIDSALVAAIAADILGAHNVICAQLPTIYTSDSSISDSAIIAQNLGCQLLNIPIEKVRKIAESLILESTNIDISRGLAGENIQARIRGMLLMAISNESGAILLATSNKSESAVGYATIYGDMCGGFAPISDLYKTQVYTLSAWRNNNIPCNSLCQARNIIPLNLFQKEPSAELRPEHKDTDTLPDYVVLDQILFCLIELNMGHIETAAYLHINVAIVKDISNKIERNEFKRNQAACGLKVNRCAMRYDRRFNS